MVQNTEDSESHDNQLVPKSTDDQEMKLATVKMLLRSIGQTVTVAFPIRSPISELIGHFARELRMPDDILQVRFEGELRDFISCLIDRPFPQTKSSTINGALPKSKSNRTRPSAWVRHLYRNTEELSLTHALF